MKRLFLLLLIPAAAFAAQLPPPADRPVDFVKDIQPLLESSCVKCHAKGKDRGGLSLETHEGLLKGGDTGGAIVPGNSAKSLMIELVSSDDLESLMPRRGKRWTPEQVGLLRAWIDQGAKWPLGLTFSKPAPENLAPRKVEPPAGGGNPVDRVLAAYFAEHGVKPAETVNDVVFARRVYLDTIGLLPSADQLDAFEKDTAADKRSSLVRSLLADRRGYADHWLAARGAHGEQAVRPLRRGAGESEQRERGLHERHPVARQCERLDEAADAGGDERVAGFSRREFEVSLVPRQLRERLGARGLLRPRRRLY